MKGSVIGAIGVIIILIVGGLVLFRSTGEDALAPTAAPEFQDQDADLAPGAADLDQFLQTAPEGSPAPEAIDDTASETDLEEVVISVDESGFVPANVQIAAGGTVRFVNNGQALHWPASDVHPTHEILPEFDAKSGLATGESYSYTFTEPGTWPMHDHLTPRNTGTITVE